MTADIKRVSEIISEYITTNLVRPKFNLEPQGVVHLYTVFEDSKIVEYYSCSFKEDDVQLFKINKLFAAFNTEALQKKSLYIKNVSYIEFDQTAVGPGKRYQVQFSFRG